MKSILSLLLSVTILSAASLAQAADPIVGSWTLNVAKSKIAPSTPKSMAETFSESTDGMISLTTKMVGADDKEVNWSASYKADGKDYPVKTDQTDPDFDSMSVKRISSHVANYRLKKAGKVIATGRAVVSKDGKTLTLTEKGTDPQGTKFTSVYVLDRE